MGLFDIFTRTKRRDELLGEISYQLKELPNAERSYFILDDLESNLRDLILGHTKDPKIVEPVYKTLNICIQHGLDFSFLYELRTLTRESYSSIGIYSKNDTGLLEKVEDLLISEIQKKENPEPLAYEILISSYYDSSKKRCAQILWGAAQDNYQAGEYQKSLHNICDSLQHLPLKQQNDAMYLIDHICLNMWREQDDKDAIELYLEFIDSPIPDNIRENLSYNFLTFYTPSEMEPQNHHQFMNVLTDIYSYADDNNDLQEFTYIAANELATKVSQKGDLDSSLDFRRNIILQMKDDDALLPTAITAWNNDIQKLKENPSKTFDKCKHSFSQHNLRMRRSYAPPMFENILLHTINKQIPHLDYTTPESIKRTVDNLLQTVSYQSQLSPYTTNDDLAANVVMNAYDLAKDNIKTDYPKLYILHNLLRLENLSPPIIHRVVNAWNEASLSEAKRDASSTLGSSLNVLLDTKRDFMRAHRNDFFIASNMFTKIPVEKRIFAEGALENLVIAYPHLSKSHDKLKAAANIIDFTQRDDPRHQRAIAWYVETYKSAKANHENLGYKSSDMYPKDTPKEIKRMFKEVEALEKAKLQENTPKPQPISPQAFLEDLKKEI